MKSYHSFSMALALGRNYVEFAFWKETDWFSARKGLCSLLWLANTIAAFLFSKELNRFSESLYKCSLFTC